MESWIEEHQTGLVVAGGIVAATAAALVIIRKITKKPEKQYPRDKVILFQIGRGPWAPSLSPFPLKLETYLRMAKIPYENVHGMRMSSKSKTPFILYNGKEYADSSFIIDFLNKEKGVDLNSHLTEEQKAVSRAFQKMNEENLYWTLVMYRWVYGPADHMKKMIQLPRFVVWLASRKVKKMTWGHGMGRHSAEEVNNIGERDLGALSVYLGEKKFFMGDQPSELDCSVFGMLAQILWHSEGSPHEKFLKEEVPNLVRFCETMRDTYWPDWEDCITHGHTKKATK